MKKIRLKILAALMAFALAALLTGCSENTQQGGAEQPESDIPAQDDIVILFTNDVHCAVDTDIGYAGLVAYRELVEQRTEYVAAYPPLISGAARPSVPFFTRISNGFVRK